MKQPWLASKTYDLMWILSPPFLATFGVAIAFYLSPELAAAPMNPWAWLLLVLAIDVSHVYASLYRTFFRAEIWDRYALPLIVAPLLCYAVGYALYYHDPLWFWRVLAYLAVFHFVRQPYGIMLLYKRDSVPEPRLWHRLDLIAIYTASLYPIYCWHLDPARQFNWFTEGDFFLVDQPQWQWLGHAWALSVLVLYLAKETMAFRKGFKINVPKNLVVFGTAVSFGFGIVYWNSDLAFTATNVIAHGVVYLGLVWWSDGKRVFHRNFSSRLQVLFPLAFVGTLLVIAYVEEGFWNVLVWDDHDQFFYVFARIFHAVGLDLSLVTSPAFLAFLVPLLALPQATHYIWDGFIWRRPTL